MLQIVSGVRKCGACASAWYTLTYAKEERHSGSICSGSCHVSPSCALGGAGAGRELERLRSAGSGNTAEGFGAVRFDATRREATRGARSVCACCSAPVRAKCGAIMAHHWAHNRARDCDPWYDTGAHDWHVAWQRQHPDEWCERVIGCHRADLLTPDGLVVEFQHSPLSPAEIAEREAFYGAHAPQGMLWVWDARAFGKRIEITRFDPATGYVAFRWKSPRKSMFTCAARQWWDLSEGWALKEVSADRGSHVAGCGTGYLARHDDGEPAHVWASVAGALRRLLTWRSIGYYYERVRLDPESSVWFTVPKARDVLDRALAPESCAGAKAAGWY
jgi:competence protein CoiA